MEDELLPLLKIAQVAAKTGTSERTIRREIKRGALRCIKIGKLVGIPRRDVERYLHQRILRKPGK